MKQVKQVIVIRTDLKNTKGQKVRTGKLIAQGSHASMAVLLNAMSKSKKQVEPRGYQTFTNEILSIEFSKDSYWDIWLSGNFTKIVLLCKDETELLKLHYEAKSKEIPTALITDNGLTEFGGTPTNTCIAIGPYWSEDIDEITKNLKLL